MNSGLLKKKSHYARAHGPACLSACNHANRAAGHLGVPCTPKALYLKTAEGKRRIELLEVCWVVTSLWGKGEEANCWKYWKKREPEGRGLSGKWHRSGCSLGKLQSAWVRDTASSRNQKDCCVEEECELYMVAGDWTCHREHLPSCLDNAKKQMKVCGLPLCEDGLQSMSYVLIMVNQGTCVSQGLKCIFLSCQPVF